MTRAQESGYSESRTMSPRRHRLSRSPRHNPSVFTRLRRERSRSPRYEYKSKARRESTLFKRLGSRGRSTSVHSDSCNTLKSEHAAECLNIRGRYIFGSIAQGSENDY
ncbi:hypothetical protein Tco_0645723 [Tanacetum coccineum]